jgi:VanZ family protein
MTARGSASERALRRATAWLLAFTVLFMLYASLYPFDFDMSRLGRLAGAQWKHTFTWRKPPQRDLVANLIFYLPFGALLISLTPRRWGAVRRLLFTLGAGTALSIFIECAQATTATRDPSIIDVALNGTSAGIAALLALGARGLGLQPALPELRTNRPDVVAVLLVATWIAFHAAPFMPSQRFVSYFTQPGRALDWYWSSGAFAGYFAGYVLVGTLLRSLLRPPSFWRLFLACAAVSLAARAAFVGQRLELAECAGFALALPLVWQIARVTEQAAYRLALLWAGPAFAFFALAPFDFSSGAPDFDWLALPALTSRLSSPNPGLLEIVFFYGGAVWLLREARLPLRRIVPGMLTVALLIEMARAWEPGRSAQLAPPLVTLAVAALVWARGRLSVTSRRAVPSD